MPLWATVAAFVVVTALLLMLVRPALRKRMATPDRALDFAGGPRSLPGRGGVVVESVDADAGVVRVAGQLWSARTLVTGTEFAAGDRVTVISVDGNTVVIDEEVSH
nr:NfeD family protein [Corynebacterium sp. TAE3-ERU12]